MRYHPYQWGVLQVSYPTCCNAMVKWSNPPTCPWWSWTWGSLFRMVWSSKTSARSLRGITAKWIFCKRLANWWVQVSQKFEHGPFLQLGETGHQSCDCGFYRFAAPHCILDVDFPQGKQVEEDKTEVIPLAIYIVRSFSSFFNLFFNLFKFLWSLPS